MEPGLVIIPDLPQPQPIAVPRADACHHWAKIARMREARLRELAAVTAGFLEHEEGMALHHAALAAAAAGPLLEIGSYCGRSALYLGSAAQRRGTLLFSVDHHRGSEEHQPGQAYHDPGLVDSATGRLDTLPAFRATIARAGLERSVVAVVGESGLIAALWTIRLGLLLIDGGHSEAATWGDYRGWSPRLAPGGLLAIHDVYPDLGDGNGRAPLRVYQEALASGWEEVTASGSLRILRRRGGRRRATGPQPAASSSSPAPVRAASRKKPEVADTPRRESPASRTAPEVQVGRSNGQVSPVSQVMPVQ